MHNEKHANKDEYKVLESREEMINFASGFGRASKRHVPFAFLTVDFQ